MTGSHLLATRAYDGRGADPGDQPAAVVLAAHQHLDPGAVLDVRERLLVAAGDQRRARRPASPATPRVPDRRACVRPCRTQQTPVFRASSATSAAPRAAGPRRRPCRRACQNRDPDNRGVRTLLLLAVGVVAVSLSGPLMAAMVVPPLAIAFWRNAFATVALGAGGRGPAPDELAGLRGRPLRLVLASGRRARAALRHLGDLADADLGRLGHRASCACRSPGWSPGSCCTASGSAPGAVRAGARASPGVLVVSGVDFTVSAQALLGDVLALVGGAAAAAYMLIGARARQATSTTTYTFVCYGTCAADPGGRLPGRRGRTWAATRCGSGGCWCWSPRPRS